MKNTILLLVCFAGSIPALSLANISCTASKTDFRQSSNPKTIEMPLIENLESAQTFQVSFEGDTVRVIVDKSSKDLFASMFPDGATKESIHVKGSFDKSGHFEFLQSNGGKNEYYPDTTLGVSCVNNL